MQFTSACWSSSFARDRAPEQAGEHGAKALEIKSSVGALPRRLMCEVRFRNPLFHAVVNRYTQGYNPVAAEIASAVEGRCACPIGALRTPCPLSLPRCNLRGHHPNDGVLPTFRFSTSPSETVAGFAFEAVFLIQGGEI